MVIVIKIPQGQRQVLAYKDKSNYYIITQDRYEKYYLYSVDKNQLVKLKTADDPTKFKECYPNQN